MPIITPAEALKLSPDEEKKVEQIEATINAALRQYDGGEVCVTVNMSNRIAKEIVRRLKPAWNGAYDPPRSPREDGALRIAQAVRCEKCRDTGVLGWGITESVCSCRHVADAFDH